MNTSQKIKETSVERSSAMEKIVRITIEPNNVQDEIQIVEGNTCDPSFIPYLLPSHIADIFICELLDSDLFGEGTILTVRNIWNRQLCDIASIVLKRARVHGQVFEGLVLKTNSHK